MSLVTIEAAGLLDGIENHARAGNYHLVSLETHALLGKMESVIREGGENSVVFRKALPAVCALIPDSTRSDSEAVLQHVKQAKEALGVTPGVTPAWPSGPTRGAHPQHPSPEQPKRAARASDVRPRSPSIATPQVWAPAHDSIDLNTATSDEIRGVLHIQDEALRAILRNRPYRSWEDFKSKNPGFSDPMLDSLKQSGLSISPLNLNRVR
jgi:hypothetical protein